MMGIMKTIADGTKKERLGDPTVPDRYATVECGNKKQLDEVIEHWGLFPSWNIHSIVPHVGLSGSSTSYIVVFERA